MKLISSLKAEDQSLSLPCAIEQMIRCLMDILLIASRECQKNAPALLRGPDILFDSAWVTTEVG